MDRPKKMINSIQTPEIPQTGKSSRRPRKQDLVLMDGSHGREDAAPPPPPPPAVDGLRNYSQMMIYYDGSLRVFNSLSQEKAQAIMLIAAASEATAVPEMLERVPSLESSTAEAPVSRPPQQLAPPDTTGRQICRLQTDLPIARRFSLQRFLEKRRARLGNKAPYHDAMKAPTTPISEGCSLKELPTSTNSYRGTAKSP